MNVGKTPLSSPSSYPIISPSSKGISHGIIRYKADVQLGPKTGGNGGSLALQS